MTPSEIAAYEAVCRADPECRCYAVIIQPTEDRRITGGVLAFDCDLFHDRVSIALAVAAVRDHLHTRLEHLDAISATPTIVCDKDGLWHALSVPTDDYGGDDICKPTTKLRATIAAHVVRLGLPRTLIEEMERE